MSAQKPKSFAPQDPSRPKSPLPVDHFIVSQVEQWLGDSQALSVNSRKNIWEFLILLTEMNNMMGSSNGKKIFHNIFDTDAPTTKATTSSAEKELQMVAQIRNQIFRSFMAFSYQTKDSEALKNPGVLKELQALKRTIETLMGVIGKTDINLLQPNTSNKQATFFQSSPSFGGLQEDLKKVLIFLDDKIEALNIHPKKAPKK